MVEETTETMIAELRDALLKHRGDDPVYYTFRRLSDKAKAGPFRCASHLRVKGNDELRDRLIEILGPSAVVRIGARL